MDDRGKNRSRNLCAARNKTREQVQATSDTQPCARAAEAIGRSQVGGSQDMQSGQGLHGGAFPGGQQRPQGLGDAEGACQGGVDDLAVRRDVGGAAVEDGGGAGGADGCLGGGGGPAAAVGGVAVDLGDGVPGSRDGVGDAGEVEERGQRVGHLANITGGSPRC